MDKLYKITKQVLVITLAFSVAKVAAFELLTEGAMGSVSAISADSAEDIINVAGDSAAGIVVDDDYEQLPFESEVSNEVRQSIILDEVSVELDFALTQEVEAWADDLQKNAGVQVDVGIVDELPGTGDASLFVPESEVQEDGVVDFSVIDEDDAVFQARRIDQSVIQSERGEISFTVERYIERVELVNREFVDQPVLGDGYVTDLRGVSNITLTAIRE